jgi:hypothetical protein
MSDIKEKPGEAQTEKVYDFIIGKINGAFVKFPNLEAVPEGTEAIVGESVKAMSKDAIDSLYSDVARISMPKKFKSKIVALESLEYQVNKLPEYGATAAAPVAANGIVAGLKAPKDATSPRAPKVPKKDSSTYELLSPPNVDEVLKSLAPQARELVAIFADLAKEKASTTVTGADVEAFFKRPEVAARQRTRQEPVRILTYYKGILISKGMIRSN